MVDCDRHYYKFDFYQRDLILIHHATTLCIQTSRIPRHKSLALLTQRYKTEDDKPDVYYLIKM